MRTLTAADQRQTTTTDARPTAFGIARAAMLELAFVAALITVYRVGRLLARQPGAATRNAQRIIELERVTGIFTEMNVQHLVLRVPGLIEFLDRYYAYVHFPAAGVFIVWLFVRHRDRYRAIRNWFAVVTLTALAIHIAFPLAPPRMTHGFIDTLHVYGPNIYSRDTTGSAANQFAAMPSLHFGWALMIALSIRSLTPRRSRWWLLHPAITLLAIVSTGNHYWIDAAIAAGLALGIAALLGRRGEASHPLRVQPECLHEAAWDVSGADAVVQGVNCT